MSSVHYFFTTQCSLNGILIGTYSTHSLLKVSSQITLSDMTRSVSRSLCDS